MDKIELIIDKPHALKPEHRVTGVSLTIIFWAITFFLWQPLISIVAWSFGVKVFYEHMIVLGGFQGLLEMLNIYLLIIVISACSLILWAKVQKWRFAKADKRTSQNNTEAQEIAKYFQIDEKQRQQWLSAKNLTVSISESFEISCQVNQK